MILNKKHAKTRESMGKRAVLFDKSMHKVGAKSNIADEEQEDDENVGRDAFNDKTDWENEDFIFVY
jgi:hypothetical protein